MNVRSMLRRAGRWKPKVMRPPREQVEAQREIRKEIRKEKARKAREAARSHGGVNMAIRQ